MRRWLTNLAAGVSLECVCGRVDNESARSLGGPEGHIKTDLV